MKSEDTDRNVTLAVALHYDEINAPRVSAKGSADVAQAIYEIARRHNVPIQDNPELVRLLSHLELGDQIPESLYLAVAEVIAFAYYLKGKVPAGYNKSPTN